MKLCKDCNNYANTVPQACRVIIKTHQKGTDVFNTWMPISEARKKGEKCGPDGKLWESKKK